MLSHVICFAVGALVGAVSLAVVFHNRKSIEAKAAAEIAKAEAAVKPK